MTAGPIRSIAIAGDGTAGWTAAAALARRLPGVTVTVIATSVAAPSLGEQFGTMLPASTAFHERIGLNASDLLRAVRGVFRLGFRLDGWATGDHGTTIGHGRYGPMEMPAPFHQAWLQAGAEAGPIAAYSAAAMLAEAGRFAETDADPAAPLGGIDVAIAADPLIYPAYLRAFALHLGAKTVGAKLRIPTVANGRIAGLTLDDGSTLQADLYIDASGPEAILLSALPGGTTRIDWSPWLPADRMVTGTAPAQRVLPPLDRAAAEANGWRLEVPLRDRTLVARVFSGDTLRDDMAAAGLLDPVVHSLPQGRRQAAWIANCVAIGDAAVVIEPLFAPHLHLMHAACDRIVALLPDTDFAPVETTLYNREWAEEVDRLRDTLIAAYTFSRRSERFWRRVRTTPLPDELAATLALFAERGRLTKRDRESFGPDQWLGLLLGLGQIQAHADVVARQLPEAAASALLAKHRDDVARAVTAAPTHAAVIAALAGTRAA